MVSAGQDTTPLTLDPPAAGAAKAAKVAKAANDVDDVVARPSGGSGLSQAASPPRLAAPFAPPSHR